MTRVARTLARWLAHQADPAFRSVINFVYLPIAPAFLNHPSD